MAFFNTISYLQVDAMIDGGAVAIDVRDEQKYNAETIERAINIHKSKLISKDFTGLNKDTDYIIFCGSGNSAKIVSNVMAGEGFKIHYLEGGFAAYKVN